MVVTFSRDATPGPAEGIVTLCDELRVPAQIPALNMISSALARLRFLSLYSCATS